MTISSERHSKISSQEALEIAVQQVRNISVRWAKVCSDLPENVQIYPRDQAKDCWSILISEGGGDHFRGSRLICISRKTGSVVYNGLSGDEG